MRVGAVVACLLAVAALSGCVEIHNPAPSQGTAPTVILVERDGSATTLSQAPTMPGPDSGAAQALSGTSSSSSSSSSTTAAPEDEEGGDEEQTEEVDEENAVPQITGFSASKLTGPAPLNITFRFGARDNDGDALNYTLHFGDGTPSKSGLLPAGSDPFHVYTGVGAKKAVLFVGDGQNVTNSSVSITVEAPPSTAPLLHYSEDVSMPCSGCDISSNSCLALILRLSGLDCAFFELPANAAGRTFVAWSDADFALSMGAWFRDDCAPSPFPFDEEGFGGVVDAGDDEVRGTVPAGSRCVVLYNLSAVGDSFPPGSAMLSIDIL